MFDILLDGLVRKFIHRRWWAAVISGAIAALIFTGLLRFVGLLPI